MRFTLQTKTKKVGEKTHRRPMCASSFTATSHLNIHILFHTGIKPFSYQQCEYKQRGNETLGCRSGCVSGSTDKDTTKKTTTMNTMTTNTTATGSEDADYDKDVWTRTM